MIESNKNLISFSGKMGVGKDYYASFVKEHIKNLYVVSWAQPLRDELEIVIKLTKEKLAPHQISEVIHANKEDVREVQNIILESPFFNEKYNIYIKNPLTRELLQFWGTEIRRNKYDFDYWVRQLEEIILRENKKGNVVLITDTRFLNEANFVQNYPKSISIHFSLDEKERLTRLVKRDGVIPSEEKLNHVSETELDDFDFEYTFDTTLDNTEENKENLLKIIEK